MADKSKMAFGSSANLQNAIDNHLVDAFDLLLLDGDTDNPKFGWVDRNGNPVIIREQDEVVVVDALPATGVVGSIYVFGEDAYVWNGEKFVNLCKPTDVSELKEQLAALEAKDVAIEEIIAALEVQDAELEKRASSVEAQVSDLETEMATKVTAEEVSTIIENSKISVEVTEF